MDEYVAYTLNYLLICIHTAKKQAETVTIVGKMDHFWFFWWDVYSLKNIFNSFIEISQTIHLKYTVQYIIYLRE